MGYGLKAVVCLYAAPLVQLFVSAGNGWPRDAPQCHWLLPITCHFQDCKRTSGHESDSCEQHYSKYPTFIFTGTHCFTLDVLYMSCQCHALLGLSPVSQSIQMHYMLWQFSLSICSSQFWTEWIELSCCQLCISM